MSEAIEPTTGQQSTTDTPSPKMGRPTVYSLKLATKLCNYLASGKSLRTACKKPGMPGMTTVFRWLSLQNQEMWANDFREQYARAKDEAADALVEEMQYIVTTPHIGTIKVTKPGRPNKDGTPGKDIVEVREVDMLGHRRLQVDTYKWIAAKLKPRKYGDRLDLTSGGDKIERGMSIEEINAVLARAEQEAAARAQKTDQPPATPPESANNTSQGV